ncbi:NUDIX hydrolase [Heyndrickxia acidicola]|uniref:NUDIX domain-containing protein n=1 Tax=Heyndrickxia acidicola TaxID=209389 RepID=A0ABU6MHD5_9BACI|nr:NUDIX domain-containing protein [Heyndrickxia acidicola]MED1203844.1 NUDIX domain-containing protein [Heyndrickxia acidicola]
MGERFKFVAAVHLFILNEKNEILLLRRYNTGYEDGNYSVVAGHLDGNEEVAEAACREAYEEAGMIIQKEDVHVIQTMHRKSKEERIDFFVTVERWSGELTNKEPEKCDELNWFPLEELPENTIPYIRRAIQNYQQNRTFDSFGWQEDSEMNAAYIDK